MNQPWRRPLNCTVSARAVQGCAHANAAIHPKRMKRFITVSTLRPFATEFERGSNSTASARTHGGRGAGMKKAHRLLWLVPGLSLWSAPARAQETVSIWGAGTTVGALIEPLKTKVEQETGYHFDVKEL